MESKRWFIQVGKSTIYHSRRNAKTNPVHHLNYEGAYCGKVPSILGKHKHTKCSYDMKTKPISRLTGLLVVKNDPVDIFFKGKCDGLAFSRMQTHPKKTHRRR